jgi:hypothetical protein
LTSPSSSTTSPTTSSLPSSSTSLMVMPPTPIATTLPWAAGIEFTAPTTTTTTLAKPMPMTMQQLQQQELRRQQLLRQYELLQKAQAATPFAYNLPRLPRTTSPTVPLTFLSATANYQVPDTAIAQYTNITTDDYYKLVGSNDVLRKRAHTHKATTLLLIRHRTTLPRRLRPTRQKRLSRIKDFRLWTTLSKLPTSPLPTSADLHDPC